MDPFSVHFQQEPIAANVKRFLNRISSYDYAVQQSQNIQQRQNGTCQWYLHTPQVQQWLTKAKSTLFCPGIIGAGKTMMAATAIDHLSEYVENECIGVAYVYCDYKSYGEQSASSILAAILKQLVTSQKPFADPLASLHELQKKYIKKRPRPSLEEISRVLVDVVARFKTVFIVIDALDESRNVDGDRDLLLAKLRELQRGTDVRLLATSRIIPEIVDKFKNAHQLEVRASAQDIRYFVDAQMNRLPPLIQCDTALRDMARDQIVQAADGMFLLARLHMQSLQRSRTLKDFRATLAGFSSSSKALDFAYDATMRTIEAQEVAHREFAMNALSWTMLAKRPLIASELCSALAVEPDKFGLNPDNVVDVHELLSLCGGLVTVDEGTNVIHFTHYTIQDYLHRYQNRWFPDAEYSIAEACTMYLSFNVFNHGICRTDEELADRLRSHCFYDYAAHHWGHHARGCSALSQRVLDFIQDKPQLDASTQVMFVDSTAATSNYSQVFPKQMTALHISAYFGLDKAVAALFNSGHQPNCKDSFGQTPLWWSIKNGHEAASKVLCEKDTITLHLLVQKNEADLVKSLLKAGYNVNTTDFCKRTPLHTAVTSGSVELATILVFAGANVNTKDMNGVTPLRAAINSKKLGLVTMLLENSANTLEILPIQWRVTAGNMVSDTLKLTERLGGGQSLQFFCADLPDEVAQMEAQSGTQRYLVHFMRPLLKWPINPGSKPQPFSVHLSPTAVDDHRWTYSVTASVPGVFNQDIVRHKGIIRIQWNVLWDTEMDCWKSVEHFSMLPYISIPQNGIEFFQQFIDFLELGWLEMCGMNQSKLSKFRGEVFHQKGSNASLLDRLLNDGQRWVDLRSRLQYQVEQAKRFVTEYCNRHDDIGALEGCLQRLGSFSDTVGDKISQLDDLLKSLIQLEFNLVSINEARLSTSTSTSMKRLSWITFIFLPLLFITGLFGMNIDLLESNPPWWLYILFATGTTFITSVIWIIFKRNPNLERNIERKFDWLISPRAVRDAEKEYKTE